MANPEQPSKNAGGDTRFFSCQEDFDVMQSHFFTNRWRLDHSRLRHDLFCQIPLIELRTIKQIKDTVHRRKVSLQTLSE